MRQRIALLSQVGYDAYRHDDGSPFFPPDEFDVTLLARPRHLAEVPPGQVRRGIPVDLDAPAELGRSLPALLRAFEVDRVVTTYEQLLLPAAQLREALGVAGMGVDHTVLLRDKLAMKRHFSAHGIRVPEFAEISEPLAAQGLLEKFGRIVVKPVRGGGSFDVHIVRDRKALIGLQHRGFAGPGRYEAEEFIAGRQFHIDSVVNGGMPLAVSVSQYLDSHETFPLGGQIRSHTLDDGPDLDTLLAFNRAVLGCLPWFSGAAHLEAFLDDRGRPVFCELGGRPGGAGIETGFRHRHGVSLLYACVQAQLGCAVTARGLRARTDRAATGWAMIYPPALGRFRGYRALPRADWLLQLTTPYRAGDLVESSTRSTDAIAVAAVCGKDSREVVGRLAEVKRAVVVSIDAA